MGRQPRQKLTVELPIVNHAERFAGLHRLVFDNWRVDELYDASVLALSRALALISAGSVGSADGVISPVIELRLQAGLITVPVAWKPASTIITSPVMPLPASLRRNAAASATSNGLDVAPERGAFLIDIQDAREPGDAGGRQRLDRARRDGIDAHVLGPTSAAR